MTRAGVLRAVLATAVVATAAFLIPNGEARLTGTAALTADFSCSPSCAVSVREKVTFTATSNSKTVNYSWDTNNDGVFDDATGPTAERAFTKAGSYPIQLQVEDTSVKQIIVIQHTVTVTTGPSARLQVVTAAPTSGSPVTLSAAGSAGGNGRIISYDWDFNGDGHFDTTTGTNPVTHFTFTTGTHTIGLRVATSTGLHATTTSTIDVVSPGARGQAGCSSELDLGRLKFLAQCVAPATDGYTLSGSQLTLNGLTLATRSGASATFHLMTTTHGAFLSGPAINVVLQNTPVGDIVVGSYDLAASPLNLTDAANAAGMAATHAKPHSGFDPLPNLGIRLFTFGVGHSCDAAHRRTDQACCPAPSPTTACATLPGGFPLAGNVSVYVDARFDAIVDLNVALNFPAVGFSATAELEVRCDNGAGVHIDTLQFQIPSANLRFLNISNAQFQYYWPDYSDPITGDTSKADSWEAQATVDFGPLHAPAMMGDLAFKHSAFDHASITLTVPGGIPLFPGVFLNRFGGYISSNPFQLGGTLGASIATTFELTLQFVFEEPTATTLGYYGGQATLDYIFSPGDQPVTIATLQGEVFSDGFFDASLTIDIHFPFTEQDPNQAVARLYGSLAFWDESSTGRFEGTGDVHLRLFRWLDVEVAGIYNNQYIAGCASADGFGVQGWYHYTAPAHGGGGFFAFSNCSDQLRPYHSQPVTAHCGPFTPGGCIGASPLAYMPPAQQGNHANLVKLPAGLPGEEIRVTSTGTPIIHVTSPNGRIQFTTPSQAGERVVRRGSYIAAIAPNTHQLLIFLKRPQAGTWKLAPASGSGRITKIESADDVPPPVIHLRVGAGKGHHRVFSYRIANYVAGSKIRFVEHGRDTTAVIGTATKAQGNIAFLPEQGMSRHRRIEADVLAAGGVPTSVKIVAHYTAPRPVRGGRPTHLRFKRVGEDAVLTWGHAANARFYLVVVRGSDKRVTQFLVRAHSPRKITILRTLPFETFKATVRAEGGPDGLAGPAAHARLRKQKAGHTTHPHSTVGKGRLVP